MSPGLNVMEGERALRISSRLRPLYCSNAFPVITSVCTERLSNNVPFRYLSRRPRPGGSLSDHSYPVRNTGFVQCDAQREQPARRAVSPTFLFHEKKEFYYVCVNSFPGPGRVIIVLLGRFPDLAFSESGLPILADSGMENAFFFF